MSAATTPQSLSSWIDDYVASQQRATASVPRQAIEEVVALVRRAGAEGRRIFVCGNGGSAANASHFATDLGKGSSAAVARPFKVISLADNVSWMTAIGNDFAYEDVFVRQLENFAERGDLLLVVSVSGNSPNVVKAAQWAREHGLVTVALVGGKRGAVAGVADRVLVVEDGHYGRVEDAQMNVLHMICYAIMELPEPA